MVLLELTYLLIMDDYFMNNVALYNWLVEKLNSQKTLVRDGSLFDGGIPTQADKPSPHSSYDGSDLWKRIRKGFPESTIRVFEVANTNSMEPLFDDNCQVIMEELTANALEVQSLLAGDVVVYTNPQGAMIIHRLMEYRLLNKDAPHWLIRGDNNQFPDGWISQQNIKFRLVGIMYGRANKKND